MEIIINGKISADPKSRILAIEAVTKAICQQTGQDPAEGIMMLMTAAAHLFATYSGKPSSAGIMDLAHSLGCATVAADDFFRLRPVSTSPPSQTCPCGDNDGHWCSLPGCPYPRPGASAIHDERCATRLGHPCNCASAALTQTDTGSGE